MLAIRHHHERWDGTGYPDGLADGRIPLFARIVAITDAYDVMITGRPYRMAVSAEAGTGRAHPLRRNSVRPPTHTRFCQPGPRGSATVAIARRVIPAAAAALELLPGTHAVLVHPAVAALRTSLSHEILASLVRQAKTRPLNGVRTKQEVLDVIVDEVIRAAAMLTLPSRRLINATGIVIHTDLGTAPLSPMARARMMEAAGATPTCADGARTEAAERLLRMLTGAEAACVTVQNAATCTLLGAALAAGREIVCAARDLLEISHGIRLQDLIEAGGGRIIPVGSANCVRLADYERAIRSPHRPRAAHLALELRQYRLHEPRDHAAPRPLGPQPRSAGGREPRRRQPG